MIKKILILMIALFSISIGRVNDYYVWNYPYENSIVDYSVVAEHIISVQKYDEEKATDIARIVYEESLNSTLEYSFVLAIIMTESRFNVNARSYCGAMGLMQLMPKTFESVAKKNGLMYKRNEAYDPVKNVKVGIAYLEYLYKRFEDLDIVAAGYNGGPGAAIKFIKKRKDQDVRVPAETVAYVKKVRKYYEIFKEMLD